MRHAFTLEYWQDDDWYVGRLKEVPGVFSQGATLAELEENIRDAYDLVLADAAPAPSPAGAESKPIEVDLYVTSIERDEAARRMALELLGSLTAQEAEELRETSRRLRES